MIVRLVILAVLALALGGFSLWWKKREGHFVEADGAFLPVDLGLSRRSARGTTIVEFFGESCAPCVVVRERLDKIAQTLPDVRVVTIDAGTRLDLAGRYAVRRVPTVFVTDERLRIRWRASGVPSEHEIMSVLLGPEWAGRPHPDHVDRLS